MRRFSHVFLAVLFIFSYAFPGSVFSGDSVHLRFKDVYNRPFYSKSWFVPVAVGGALAAGAVFTVYTGGTGAPAAGAGVSTTASAIAGGGAGSYMAGLSIVGSWFGGNAILGAAILNGISAGVLGTVSSAGVKAVGGAAFKTIALASGRFTQIVLTIEDGNRTEVIYSYPVMLSHDIGSKETRAVLDDLKEAHKDLQKERIDEREFNSEVSTVKLMAKNKLESLSEKPWSKMSADEKEDFTANLLILRQFSKDEFLKFALLIQPKYTEKQSFLWYLLAIANLDTASLTSDVNERSKYIEAATMAARKAKQLEPEVLEPVMLEAIAIAVNGQLPPLRSLEKDLDNYSKNHYSTPNSESTVYSLFGDIAHSFERYEDALVYHEEAWDESSWFLEKKEKAYLSIKLAKAYKMVGDSKDADYYYDKAKEYIDGKDNAAELLEGLEEIWNG